MTESFRCPFRSGPGPVLFEHTAFGIADDKGRELGAVARIYPITVELGPVREYHSLMTIAPGLYFEVSVQVTRDEKPFGASPRRHLFESLDAARAKADELVAGARKRYAKRAAAGQKL